MTNRIRNLALVAGLASLALAGCGESPTQVKVTPPSNHPVSSLYVSPQSGVAPLADTVRYSCLYPDNDPKTSELSMGGNAISTRTSLDTVITLNQNSSFTAQCIDTLGNVSTRGPINITVSQPPSPSFSQTANRVNFSDIDYSVNLQNLQQATSKMFRNDTLVSTSTVTGPNYSERITNNPKGQIYFVLEAPGVNPDTVRVTIPNDKPRVDLSGVSISMDQGDSTVAILPIPTDSNKEDNPVPYTFARSLDGKTQVSIVKDSLKVKPVGNNSGQFRILIGYGTQNGGTDSSIVPGNINSLPGIAGNFQNSETWTGAQGTLRPYGLIGTDTIPIFTNTSDSLGNNLTDANGNFSFRLKQLPANLEKILLMARQGTPGNYQGYVRTIGLLVKDTAGVLIRGVPYPTFTSPDTLNLFLQQLAGDPPKRFDFDGKYIPGFNGFQGIEILSQNPYGAEYGTFTLDQQNFIKNQILDPNNINGLIRNRINSSEIIFGDQGHYTLDSSLVIGNTKFRKVIPNPGWIMVVPYTDIISLYGATGLTDGFGVGLLGESATEYFIPGAGSDSEIVSREFGHAFLGNGEPPILPNQSVMGLSSNLKKAGPADIKAGMIFYEPTFMFSDGIFFPHVDYFENITRTNFK